MARSNLHFMKISVKNRLVERENRTQVCGEVQRKNDEAQIRIVAMVIRKEAWI